MSEWETQDILYKLCTMLLNEQKVRLQQQSKNSFSIAEVNAELKIARVVYELAAGAALRNKIPRSSTNSLVEQLQDIEDTLTWNMRNSRTRKPTSFNQHRGHRNPKE